MNVIRSAFLWAFMFLTIALMGPVHIFCGLFIDRTGALSYRIATAYLRLCCLYIGMKIRIVGAENVPQEGSFIVMPNHRSWWDIPAVQLAIYPRQLRFIYKKQLENLPILGWCIKVGGHIGIDREDRERAVRVLRDVARRFSGHFSLVIFPEGTRSPGRHLQRFKRGGFHLSRELELPVIPVSISGSQVIQSRHTMTFHPGTVTITFHPAVSATDFASLDAMITHVKAQVFAGLTDGAPEPAPAPAGRAGTTPAGRTVALLLALGLSGLGLATAPGRFGAPAARAQGLEIAASAASAPARSTGRTLLDPDTLAVLFRAAGGDPATLVVDPVGRRLEPAPRFPALALAEAAGLEPLRAPALLGAVAGEALDALIEPGGVLEAAARAQDHPVPSPAAPRGVSLQSADRPRPAALYDAIAGFYAEGKRLDGKKRDDLRRFVQDVPEPVGRAAARLIDAARAALATRQRAFRNVPLGANVLGKGAFVEAAMTWVDSLAVTEPEAIRRRVEAAAAATDFEMLNQGGADLARALTELSGWSLAGPPFSFAWDTPQGRIAINRHGEDRYAGDYLLIIDLDGNDTYLGGGRTTALSPVSVILDLAGDDRYAPADSTGPGPGGAVAGYALIDDRGGDDSYRAWRVGLGAGVFGVGLLLDRAGRDSLEALTASVGAGFFGLGIVADLQGDDVYRVAQAGQGCGGPGGVGWLLDRAGDDLYETLDRPVPAAPAVTDPLSRAQGCAFGRDETGHSWPGGCGLLADRAGNDRYRAGDLGQGYGDTRGVGLLVDFQGDDDYRLATGGLGTGRGQGVGLLLDVDGRDAYACMEGAGLGAAERLGLGLCVDARGDDTYSLRENGLACAAGPGLALFLEGAGDDRYAVDDPSAAFGAAVPPCSCDHTLQKELKRRAFFLDLGGRDSYPGPRGPNPPRDAATWRSAAPEADRWLTQGVGSDRP